MSSSLYIFSHARQRWNLPQLPDLSTVSGPEGYHVQEQLRYKLILGPKNSQLNRRTTLMLTVKRKDSTANQTNLRTIPLGPSSHGIRLLLLPLRHITCLAQIHRLTGLRLYPHSWSHNGRGRRWCSLRSSRRRSM